MDALCVGVVGGVTCAWGRVLGICAMGRVQRLRSRFDRWGFSRGYLPRHKRVFGFAMGDLVRADVARGHHLGIHTGRVVVRASGSFRVGLRDGIHWRRCTLLARGDGYEYSLSARIAETTNHLHAAAAPPPI